MSGPRRTGDTCVGHECVRRRLLFREPSSSSTHVGVAFFLTWILTTYHTRMGILRTIPNNRPYLDTISIPSLVPSTRRTQSFAGEDSTGTFPGERSVVGGSAFVRECATPRRQKAL
ncbi:hypothetical protein BD309DRAFT_700064 [Dichomitus squalens]|nr:hypothetical protein BD309DRAFT_700064 [Dichomitus squalens]